VFAKDGCPTSGLVVTRLAPLEAALNREGRPLLAVFQGDDAGAAAFRDAYGLAMPVACDAAPHEASRAYGITTVPTLLVVDGAGVIAERLEGFVKSEYLALGASLEQALALGDIPPVLERPEDLPAAQPG